MQWNAAKHCIDVVVSVAAALINVLNQQEPISATEAQMALLTPRLDHFDARDVASRFGARCGKRAWQPLASSLA